jgi:hypothetical protein
VAGAPLDDEAKRLLHLGAGHMLQGRIAAFKGVGLASGLRDLAPGEGHHITVRYACAPEK